VGGNHFSFLFYAAANRKYSKINLYFALDFSYCAAKVNVKQTGRQTRKNLSLAVLKVTRESVRFSPRETDIYVYIDLVAYI